MSKIPEWKRQKVAMFSSWGGWSRSSENIQESRSNDPASEGLHLITLIIVLQLEVIWGWFWIINRSSNTSIKKSRMNREVHVRFCERFRGENPLYLLDFWYRLFVKLTACNHLEIWHNVAQHNDGSYKNYDCNDIKGNSVWLIVKPIMWPFFEKLNDNTKWNHWDKQITHKKDT